MESNSTNLLDDDLTNRQTLSRRKLLPVWIKVFCWFFMIAGVMVVPGLIAGILGMRYTIELYGLGTTDPLSYLGILLTLLFILKGIAAFCLWTEKDWAIRVAQADAITGIVVCCATMFILPIIYNTDFGSFRFEIILLSLYLTKMLRIKEAWDK